MVVEVCKKCPGQLYGCGSFSCRGRLHECSSYGLSRLVSCTGVLRLHWYVICEGSTGMLGVKFVLVCCVLRW